MHQQQRRDDDQGRQHAERQKVEKITRHQPKPHLEPKTRDMEPADSEKSDGRHIGRRNTLPRPMYPGTA